MDNLSQYIIPKSPPFLQSQFAKILKEHNTTYKELVGRHNKKGIPAIEALLNHCSFVGGTELLSYGISQSKIMYAKRNLNQQRKFQK